VLNAYVLGPRELERPSAWSTKLRWSLREKSPRVPREKPLTCDREKSSRTCGPHACALARVSRERLESRSEFPMRIFEVRRLSRAVVFGRVGLFVSFFGRFSVLSERDARERRRARAACGRFLSRASSNTRAFVWSRANSFEYLCLSFRRHTRNTEQLSREKRERDDGLERSAGVLFRDQARRPSASRAVAEHVQVRALVAHSAKLVHEGAFPEGWRGSRVRGPRMGSRRWHASAQK